MKNLLVFAAAFAICASSADAADSGQCTAQPIVTGYGADGSYGVETEQLPNPGDAADNMTIYFPKGAEGPRPVIFFAHGFGPGLTDTYADLLRHMTSKGYIVVFSTYPMRGVTVDQRYDSLWQGFAAAVAQFHARMDLSRVGFVGHSFGGGAVPAMAFKGLVTNGWGSKGAFSMALAPWYSYQITDAQIAAIPAGDPAFFEVYDKDSVVDHRMAIHLDETSRAADRYYFMVQSDDACGFTADHATPGRNQSLIQKQYAVFKPFDALADLAFNGDSAARAALNPAGTSAGAYQPLQRSTNPTPDQPQSNYRWGWDNDRNPLKH
jgi:dienelactone hydrolase